MVGDFVFVTYFRVTSTKILISICFVHFIGRKNALVTCLVTNMNDTGNRYVSERALSISEIPLAHPRPVSQSFDLGQSSGEASQ